MKVLLDTHAFLWFIEGSLNLSTAARGLIETSSDQSLLSVASLWEMAIKISLVQLGRNNHPVCVRKNATL
jgi:PIN domain nuclease of toxin-antitoxin system